MGRRPWPGKRSRGDWSDALVTISNEQVPDVVSGTTLTPVPLESSRQLGDRGIVPSQEGHFTVRVKRYAQTYLFARRFESCWFPGSTSGCGSSGYRSAVNSRTRSRNLSLMPWKFSSRAHPCFWGHSQVARENEASYLD